MKIGKEQVRHVALLARLHLSETEIEQFTGQLDDILTYIEKLNELDTKDVKPTSHVIEVGNVLREDTAEKSLSAEEALANAPDPESGFFKVPKIL